jgi:hypothetical protein
MSKAADDRQASMPPWGVGLLGVLMIALGVGILYELIAIWPAVDAATAESPASKKVAILGFDYNASPQTALILLVVFSSALGSYIHAATSFADYVGNRRLAASWTWWYLLRTFVGAALGVLFYFAVRGGFFSADTPENVINPYGIAALAGLVGLFSKQATDKLRELFDTLFRVAEGYGDEARGDSIANPAPLVAGVEPPSLLVGGDLVIRLAGEGFIPSSLVRVSRADQPGVVLERQARYIGPTELDVTLDVADVAAAGVLNVVVFNPAPGGGVSGPLTIEVTIPGETGTAGGADETAATGSADETGMTVTTDETGTTVTTDSATTVTTDETGTTVTTGDSDTTVATGEDTTVITDEVGATAETGTTGDEGTSVATDEKDTTGETGQP